MLLQEQLKHLQWVVVPWFQLVFDHCNVEFDGFFVRYSGRSIVRDCIKNGVTNDDDYEAR